MAFSRQKKHKSYILKPESGCQGKGIWITKNVKDIKPHEHMVCQQYVSRVRIFYYIYLHFTTVNSVNDSRLAPATLDIL